MSQVVFDTIDPSTTSGNQLATILNDFKDAVMSGLIGSTRPTQLEAGGFWVDNSLQISQNVWDFKIYTGTVDITVFRLNLATGTPSITGSENTFEVTRISADSVGPIFKLIKERVASNGQTLFNDVLGEIQFQGTDNSGINTVAVRIKAIATDTFNGTEAGATLVFEAVNTDSNVLAEVFRIVDGKMGLGTTIPSEKLHVEGNLKADKIGDDAIGAKKILRKKRVSGNGQVLANDIIAVEEYRSTDEAGNEIVVGQIEVSALENHTGTAQGTKVIFKTKAIGTNVFADQIIIGDNSVDIPNLKIGTVSALELSYLDGVTSSIQTQLNGKATPADITTAINNLVNGAGAALDTLSELANALGNDANFATTVSTALANRLRVDTNAQGLTGTQKTNAKTNIDLQNVDNTSDATKNSAVATLTNKTIIGASIQDPIRSDAKKDTKANLITYATTAQNGELLYATDTKTYHGVKDGALVDIGGGGGVGGVDIFYSETAENAQLTDYTQTGLEISDTPITLHGTKSFRFVHASGSEKNMKYTKAVDRKFRGKVMTFSLDVVATTTSGNATILFRDETNSADIGVAQVISTGSSAITATTANASASMVLTDTAVFNTLKVGMLVTGSAIPNGTVITALNTATLTATLSQNATGVSTGIRVSSLTTKRDFSVLVPTNCASISYTIKALAEANNVAIYFDDITWQLQEYAKTSASFSVPKNNNYSGVIQSGITIGATTTAPTKGTIVTDRIIHSRVENRLIADYQFEQSSTGTNGTGEYLFTLPNSLQFDSSVPFYTSSIYSSSAAKCVVGHATIFNSDSTLGNGSLIAYDATRFRVVVTNISSGTAGGISEKFFSSSWYNLGGQSPGFNFHLDAPISGWSSNETETKNIALTSSVLVTQPDSYLRINASAGTTLAAGSVATRILSFANCTVQENIGSAIQYIDDSSNGARFVAQAEGLYRFHFSADLSTTSYFTGFSKNASSLTTSLVSLPNSERLNTSYDGSSAAMLTVSAEAYLKVGDVVRVHTDGPTINTTTIPNLIVSYQGSTKIINPSTDQKVSVPYHYIRFEGCSGRGSTDTTIFKFDTQTAIQGDAWDVLNTVANGTVITMKKAGFLSITANADVTASTSAIYVTKNQTSLTSAPPRSEILAGNIGDVPLVTTNLVPVSIGDKIRVASAQSIVGDYPMAIFSMTLVETSVAVALQNVSPNWDNGDSSILLNTLGSGSAGYGSTNTAIYRFVNTETVVGTDVTYSDSATEGAKFLINTSGLYTIVWGGVLDTVGNSIGISKNSTQLSTDISNIAVGERLAASSVATTGADTCAAWTGYLNKGDIIRPHGTPASSVTARNARNKFSIARVGKTSGTVDVTPFVQVPQNDVEAINYLDKAQNTLLDLSGEVRFPSSITTTNKGIIQIVDDSANTRTRFVALKDCSVNISWVSYASTSVGYSLIYKNGVIIHRGSYSTTTAPLSLASVNINLSAGDFLSVGNAINLDSSTATCSLSLTATAQSTSVITQTQQISSDTINFSFSSVALTGNEPIGTFNCYTKTASTQYSSVLSSVAPTQSVSSMNTNGIQIQCSTYAGSSTTSLPSRFDIVIGKGLQNIEFGSFGATSKATPLITQYWAIGTTEEYGLTQIYDPITGILRIDLGINNTSTSTTRRFQTATTSGVTTPYITFACSKTPSLASLSNTSPRVAYITDVKSVSSGGGTSSTSWTNRDLNTIVDPTGIVSTLSGNTITLPAGTYEFHAVAPCASNTGGEHGLRVQNTTDGTTVDYSTGYAAVNTSDQWITVICQTTITTAKTFGIQMIAPASQVTWGLGQNGTLTGVANVFTRVKITKIR